MIDIASEAQLQLESDTTKPARNHLPVPGQHKKHYGRQRGSQIPKINISNISKTMAGLNPVKKMKLSRLKRKVPFMPAVWYRKSQEEDEEEEEERARILKGDRILTEQFVDDADAIDVIHRVSSPKSPNAPMSIDDIDITRVLDSDTSSDLSDYDMESQGSDDHVVLTSCGVLTVDSRQILEMLATGVDIPGWSKTAANKDEVKIDAMKSPSQQKSTKTLDQAMKFRSMSIDVGDKKEMKKNWKKSPAKEVGRQDLVTFLTPENTTVGAKSVRSPLVEEEAPMEHTNGACCKSDSVFDDVLTQDNDVSVENDSAVVAAELHAVVSTSPPIAWECDLDVSSEKVAEEEESWVNVNIKEDGSCAKGQDEGHSPSQGDDEAANVQLHHPCMKMSFSEGSIAATYHAEVEEMNIDLDELELDSLSHVSPLSRLKVKMSAIALPNMPSPQSKRRHAQRVARHNRLKSQLRFQECQTKVLLL